MTFPRAVSLITLGVADIERSLAFYSALGFRNTVDSQDTVKFMRAANTVIGLFSRAALAEDAHVADEPTGFAAVTLALNFADEAQVDAMHARALASGAREVKRPVKVFWGGYSGYFADPDGHLWEIAHNPHFAMDADGRLALEEAR